MGGNYFQSKCIFFFLCKVVNESICGIDILKPEEQTHPNELADAREPAFATPAG